jgi:hypothetical protein
MFFCTVPKVPAMHRVRLFGVNTTVGIDDKKEEWVKTGGAAIAYLSQFTTSLYQAPLLWFDSMLHADMYTYYYTYEWWG